MTESKIFQAIAENNLGKFLENLEKLKDINCKNEKGETPLSYLFQRPQNPRFLDMLILLLQRNPDINANPNSPAVHIIEAAFVWRMVKMGLEKYYKLERIPHEIVY